MDGEKKQTEPLGISDTELANSNLSKNLKDEIKTLNDKISIHQQRLNETTDENQRQQLVSTINKLKADVENNENIVAVLESDEWIKLEAVQENVDKQLEAKIEKYLN